MKSLSDIDDLVLLQRELPFRMKLHKLDGFLQDFGVFLLIPHITWLHIIEVGIHAAVGNRMLAIEDNFQFGSKLDNWLGVF